MELFRCFATNSGPSATISRQSPACSSSLPMGLHLAKRIIRFRCTETGYSLGAILSSYLLMNLIAAIEVRHTTADAAARQLLSTGYGAD